MKKIVLFAAAMMICAGIAFAQEPVKKSADKKTKIECQQVATQDKAAATTVAPKQHCGNCPHHAKPAANVKPEAKPAKPECNKGEKSCCNKEAKGTCKKEENKTAKK